MYSVEKFEQNLLEKPLSKFNVFISGDIEFCKHLMAKFCPTEQYQKIYCSTMDGVRLSTRNNLFLQIPRCIQIYSDLNYLTDKAHWDSDMQKIKSGKDYIFLIYPNINKSKEFLAFFDEYIVDLSKVPKSFLKDQIAKYIPNLSIIGQEKLIAYCDGNLTQIKNECAKLKDYWCVHNETPDKALDHMFASEEISIDTALPQWKLIDAIFNQDLQTIIAQLNTIAKDDGASLYALAIIYKSLQDVLCYQGLGDNVHRVSELTNLSGYALKQAQNRAYKFSNEFVAEILHRIQHSDSAIKTGEEKAIQALNIIVLQLLGGENKNGN